MTMPKGIEMAAEVEENMARDTYVVHHATMISCNANAKSPGRSKTAHRICTNVLTNAGKV